MIKILWADDEIDLLKPHILFLKKKGYHTTTCTSGIEAIEKIEDENFDVVFLDENMPGISGLETLLEIKKRKSSTPVIMITKSEEEYIMEEAIGSKIADYLIKPVNPNQILLSLKKTLDHSRLVSKKTTADYQQEFRKIAMDMTMVNDFDGWADLYKKLVYWEIALENIEDAAMAEILETQKTQANQQFAKFIEKNYENWFYPSENTPLLSHTIFKEKVVTELEKEKPVLFVVIDNLRYDQWKVLEKNITPFYKKRLECTYSSILPTATQYARNAIFSGLTPLEMEKQHPDLWKNDIDQGGKNLHEKAFLEHQLKRLKQDITFEYHKIASLKAGKKLAENFKTQKQNKLTVVVYNFVDMLSHAKTEMEVIKELAATDKSYRSLTASWFKNAPLLDIIQQAKELGFTLVLTTDHGTINVKTPSKVIGDKNISTNLRYKTAKSLTYEKKEVLEIQDPSTYKLPSIHMSSSYIFAKTDTFFAYPNNYNYYANYYKNTYQHGGVSLEEMILPFIVLDPK